MSHTCVKCQRVNPDEAIYCYYDGMLLNGHGRAAGPVAIGSQPFPGAFIFPSGRSCRSFDELAIAIQENWEEARNLLKQGFLNTFFGGLGRADLAQAADEARKYPDIDRGLDQLLGKLPSGVIEEPKLRVNLQEINLGVLEVGQDRTIDLRLENQGGRLVFGTITAENAPWIALGDPQGTGQKLFEFHHDIAIPVHVKGARLRANNKPLEARLTVESNAGSVVVIVRADVPIKPFPGKSALAGARSPRQVAERAKANPKVAAQLFEKGEVSAWYKANGWAYPVPGPCASGIAAVQQFFEALGLTPPPKVDISERTVTLHGNAGDNNLRHVLTVRTQEKKPVYAHGVSNAAWLEVSRARMTGASAEIVLTVPTVPNKPGETLTARVAVQSNGKQRFVVPVTLHIGHTLDFTAAVGEPLPMPEPITADAPARLPTAAVVDLGPPPVLPLRRPRPQSGFAHILPAIALAVALLIVVLVDVLNRDKTPEIGEQPDLPKNTQALLDIVKNSKPMLTPEFDKGHPSRGEGELRFGLTMVGVKDPTNPKKFKQLTFDPSGGTNNTIIKIDNHDYYFGRKIGTQRWGSRAKDRKTEKYTPLVEVIPDRYWTCTMDFTLENVRVTQHVMLVPGQPGGPLDTCLVFYEVKNNSDTRRHVAVRMMLDTYIGANDGTPFAVPGRKGLLDSMEVFGRDKAVPDFVEAVEKPEDVKDQGTVARLTLKDVRVPDHRGDIVPMDDPEKLVICRYPGNPQANWEWEYQAMDADVPKDSCAVVYWPEQNLDSGQLRYVGLTYGLGKLEVGELKSGVAVGVSVPANARKNKPFIVTGYVYNGRKGDEVTLDLPEGLKLAPGETAVKKLEEDGKRTAVFWNVVSEKADIYELKARCRGSESRPVKVKVNDNSIFG
jgi:hypothetical protein